MAGQKGLFNSLAQFSDPLFLVGVNTKRPTISAATAKSLAG
jgi:hypothetical protein